VKIDSSVGLTHFGLTTPSVKPDYTVSSGRINCEKRMGKDVEGSGRGPI